jgi:subtilisin family serine protease
MFNDFMALESRHPSHTKDPSRDVGHPGEALPAPGRRVAAGWTKLRSVSRLGPASVALAVTAIPLAVGVLVARPAFADQLAPAVVRMLHTPGKSHPLADGNGRVPLTVALPRGVDPASFGLLPVAPGVGAIRLAPEEVAIFAAAHPDLAIGVAPRIRPLLDVSPIWTHVDAFRTATSGLTGKGVVVGVVDTGLDVRHPDFLTADGHTRVAWMLAAIPPKGLHADLEREFGCTDASTPCAVLAAADIDALLQAGSTELTDTVGHGTHVTSIAAGNGGISTTSTPRYVGLAPDATIVVAQPSSGEGFFDSEVLNAARFVFDRADAIGAPVVVNLSLGSDYGPHDGTSNLEQGLSAMVGDAQPGRAIVVAAGNSAALSALPDGTGPLGIHTEAHVFPSEDIRIPLIPVAPAANGTVFVWLTFRPGDDVSVGLEGPCGSTWVDVTAQGDQGSYQSGGSHGGVVNDLPSADASLTSGTNSAIAVFSGAWEPTTTCGGASALTEFAIHLRGHGDASLWITGQDDAASAVYFLKAIEQGTINVPATAPGLLAVGCTVNRVSWQPLTGPKIELGQLDGVPNPSADGSCYFSSRGPTPFGLQKPELSAPGGFVAAAMSVDADPRTHPGGLFDMPGCPPGTGACAVVDATHALASGTSMSAPHVTGAIALLMGLDPTLTQARATAALTAGARLSTGSLPDPDQLGIGSLDIDGARVALLDAAAASVAASPTRSWYTLSSGYARPDATWPVWGNVELRKKDGTVADGIDGSQLRLTLTGGGTVLAPLTQVRQGLFRFAVAALPRDLGGALVVDVTYAGVSLGERTLPVGWDTWSASDPSVGAVGACAATRGARAPAAPIAALGACALAALARRRRREHERVIEFAGAKRGPRAQPAR